MKALTPPKKPAQQDWHPAQVICELRMHADLTLRGLARQHGISHKTLQRALRRSFPKSEKRIADALGLHPADIWPSRYNPDGTLPVRRGRKPSITIGPKPTTASNAGKVNSRECR